MTEPTEALKAQYRASYGPSYYPVAPDFTRCVEEVFARFISHQCKKKRGHGPEGAWCKKHDPVAREARYQNAVAIAEKEERREQFRDACVKAVQDIAEGLCENAQGHCYNLLTEYKDVQTTTNEGEQR
jgi:hypothetical protein